MEPQAVNPLIELDQTLFHKVNSEWTSPLLDMVMPILTDLHRQPVVLLGLFPLLVGIWVYRQKTRALQALLAVTIAVGASDIICHRVLKPLFERERPAAAGIEYHLRTTAHTGLSFPSNHAANNMAGAVILATAIPGYGWVFILFALLVAYSRIYVGVHFPLDVAAGLAVGLAIGLIVRFGARRWIKTQG